MTAIDRRSRICAVCALVLDYVNTGDPDNPGFRHTETAVERGVADHLPVPVEPGPLYAITFCDLCHAVDPDHLLPARDFMLVGGDASSGDWSICGQCARQVETNRWNEILRRMVAGFYARNGIDMEPDRIAVIAKNHRLLRKHIIGAPHPGRLPTPDTKDS